MTRGPPGPLCVNRSTPNSAAVLCRQISTDLRRRQHPSSFELIYVCCEAISTYHSVFSKRGIQPRCLVYIRPGTAFGGNFSDYSEALERTMRANTGEMPEFILYDQSGGNAKRGDYLPLLDGYRPIQRWDYRTEHYGMANVTLASRLAVMG